MLKKLCSVFLDPVHLPVMVMRIAVHCLFNRSVSYLPKFCCGFARLKCFGSVIIASFLGVSMKPFEHTDYVFNHPCGDVDLEFDTSISTCNVGPHSPENVDHVVFSTTVYQQCVLPESVYVNGMCLCCSLRPRAVSDPDVAQPSTRQASFPNKSDHWQCDFIFNL
ncbi:hypothetical protein Nepgr_021625 [Nepenthes gracilis]|uniref:Uncharacterized protein n=1 Tax=Nepenthes gracilis TaxID=150966 RepID=A0AAD3XX77_NEPGR|nr:hypothetical protein Nepgr_021625 [Nepenthes gracilis]